MAIRIEWDEFEIALLIEACEEVLHKGKPKSEVVKTVSSNLRKRAINKNIVIDDVFRNENGIALQMQKMTYLLTHGEKGMSGASKLYQKTHIPCWQPQSERAEEKCDRRWARQD